jgi:hypothetical protein
MRKVELEVVRRRTASQTERIAGAPMAWLPANRSCPGQCRSDKKTPGAAASNGRTIVVGPHEQVTSIKEAARIARDGDTIEIRSGEYRQQAVVWTQNRLTIRGTGKRPLLIADGDSAEGKALWVVRNAEMSIENIEFRGVRVPRWQWCRDTL